MLRKLFLTAAFVLTIFAFDNADAEAAKRRGLFSRIRANQSQRYARSRSYSSSRSTKLHMTHSTSAILDGFFGPYPGVGGHDRSWYIGK